MVNVSYLTLLTPAEMLSSPGVALVKLSTLFLLFINILLNYFFFNFNKQELGRESISKIFNIYPARCIYFKLWLMFEYHVIVYQVNIYFISQRKFNFFFKQNCIRWCQRWKFAIGIRYDQCEKFNSVTSNYSHSKNKITLILKLFN